MKNLYERLTHLLPGEPLRLGTVQVLYPDGTALVTLAEGGSLRVGIDGDVSGGARVYVRGGRVLGSAPDLPFVEMEV